MPAKIDRHGTLSQNHEAQCVMEISLEK